MMRSLRSTMLATLASLVVAGSQTGSAADFDFYISAPAVQSSYVPGTGGSSTETFNTLSAVSIGASGS